jgi:hypothetical protein
MVAGPPSNGSASETDLGISLPELGLCSDLAYHHAAACQHEPEAAADWCEGGGRGQGGEGAGESLQRLQRGDAEVSPSSLLEFVPCRRERESRCLMHQCACPHQEDMAATIKPKSTAKELCECTAAEHTTPPPHPGILVVSHILALEYEFLATKLRSSLHGFSSASS